jgi:hypothetical protein
VEKDARIQLTREMHQSFKEFGEQIALWKEMVNQRFSAMDKNFNELVTKTRTDLETVVEDGFWVCACYNGTWTNEGLSFQLDMEHKDMSVLPTALQCLRPC